MGIDQKRNNKNKIGERRIMNCGEEAEIIEYRNSKNVIVKFVKTGELIKCQYGNFKNGEVKSRFTPSVFGIGMVGLEKTKENGKTLKTYTTWRGMLRRCYDEKELQKYPTYIGCSVCDEWLYYPNFKKWYEENYYEVTDQRMCLDKDILKKGNKIYSPETCMFVPNDINMLSVKSNKVRGDLPIGVSWDKKNKKYICHCSVFDIGTSKYKTKHLGLYNTPEEAFNVYKKIKEENIKQVADYYKDRIPKKLYDAMYNYKVEITD